MGCQYTGSAGKVTNCQIGVFAAYVSARGHAFVDRALYLPRNWTTDPLPLAAAHVPESTAFATKPTLAVKMIVRALTTDMPFAWVAADAVYGVGDIEQVLRRAGKPVLSLPKGGNVLGVKGDHRFGSWGDKPVVAGTAAQIASDLDPGAWHRLSAGNGTKGARLHDRAYLELVDLEADEYAADLSGIRTRGLLIRRHVADGDLAFFTTWCPAGTTMETLVRVEGHRWAEPARFR